METYRSGHNGAHSKCVCPFGARGFESHRLRDNENIKKDMFRINPDFIGVFCCQNPKEISKLLFRHRYNIISQIRHIYHDNLSSAAA